MRLPDVHVRAADAVFADKKHPPSSVHLFEPVFLLFCRSNSSSKPGVSVSTTSPPNVKANSAAAAAHPSDDSNADPLLKTLTSEAEDDEVDTGAAGWAATLGVVGGLAVLLGGGYVFKDAIKQFLDFFIQAVDDWGVWGYVAYAAVYAGLEVLAVPAIPLTMTAGVIFGPLPGTVIVSVSGTVAATIAFLIARYAARDKVRRQDRNGIGVVALFASVTCA